MNVVRGLTLKESGGEGPAALKHQICRDKNGFNMKNRLRKSL